MHITFLLLTCQEGCGLVFIPLSLIGICFAFYCVIIIPTIPLIVNSKYIGTAFGLESVVENIALSLLPIVSGMVFDDFGDNDFERSGL